MKNKTSRHQSVINRQSDSSDCEDHWLKQFEQKLQKDAVQPRSESLFDQINTIMNGKSKHTSVQAVVDDMMQRSGYSAYMENIKLSEEENSNIKKASEDQNGHNFKKNDKNLPRVINEKPSIANTLENLINKGNMSVPAIIARLRSLHINDVPDDSAWEDDDLIRYVSRCNLKAKLDNPANYEDFNNLGKTDHSTDNSDMDPSNTDAFHALMPTKI